MKLVEKYHGKPAVSAARKLIEQYLKEGIVATIARQIKLMQGTVVSDDSFNTKVMFSNSETAKRFSGSLYDLGFAPGFIPPGNPRMVIIKK